MNLFLNLKIIFHIIYFFKLICYFYKYFYLKKKWKNLIVLNDKNYCLIKTDNKKIN
jgi:hypothetical protein